MKIVINALSARRGGGQTYLINLLQRVTSFKGQKIYVLAPASLDVPHHPKIESLQVVWPTDNPLLRAFWERLFLPRLLDQIGADALFCPGGLVSANSSKKIKTITMFRNMLPFDHIQRKQYPLGLMRIRNWMLEWLMLKSMLRADLVIFIAEFAKRVIEDRTRKRLKQGVTIYHGLGDHFKISENNAPPRPSWLPREDYLLYVSKLEVYKNQVEVVKGYHLLKQRRKTPEKLLLVGDNSSNYGKRVLQEISRLGLEKDVLLTGGIKHIELPALYHHAKLNIFASRCENCPNILIEAMGAGRPLLASHYPPMPEFGGEAAVYFDPSSPEDITTKIASIIDNADYMSELANKTREQSFLFDWDHTAELTWRTITRLIN